MVTSHVFEGILCVPNFVEISQYTAEILLLQPYWNTISGFHIDLFTAVQIGQSPTELRRHIDFTRWRPLRRKCASSFWFVCVWHLRKPKAISIPNISICGRDITTSVFWTQTTAILKFYSRFQFWLSQRHWHVILHWPTSYYANWMIADGRIMSYRFYKMAATASQIYFRFLVWPRHTFKMVSNYWRTRFRPNVSIHGRDITTSGSWKQTPAILKFYFQFQFWPVHCNRRVILLWPTDFHANQMIADAVMTSY